MSRIITALLAAAFTLAVAACSAGSLSTPGPSAGIAGAGSGPGIAAVTGSPATREPPTPTVRPTEIPGPPAASLAGGLEGPVPGELGAVFWGGLGSDSPWIVPSSALAARVGAPLLVALSPALAPERWTVSWAPLRNGTAGRIADRVERAWSPITFRAPAQAGPWGAQVELHLSSGERAAFYWRVDVVP